MRHHRPPTLTLTLLVALAGTPAAATTAASPVAREGAVVTDPPVTVDLSSVEDRFGDPIRRGAAALLTDVIERAGDVAGEGLLSSLDLANGTADSAGTVRPAGDLNGDGYDDVLVLEGDLATGEPGMRALDGRDGELLWARDPGLAGFLYLLPGIDLTGDGAADVVAVDLLSYAETSEDCSDTTTTCEVWTATYTWRQGTVSGRTGSTVWSVERQGSDQLTTTSTGLGATREQHYVLSNGFVFPHVVLGPSGWTVAVGDQERDATYEERNIGVPDVFAVREASRTTEEVLTIDFHDAATGTIERTLDMGPRDAENAVRPITDLDADGLPELLVRRDADLDYSSTCQIVVYSEVECVGGEDITGELAVIDGATLEPWWTRQFPAVVDGPTVLDADVDGDARGDLATGLIDPEAGTWVTDVLAARDGATLFTDPETPTIHGAPDLDGDGLDDLLRIDGGADLVRIDRVRGLDGSVLFGTTHPAAFTDEPGADETWFVVPGQDDVNGDGLPDLLVNWVRWRRNEQGLQRPHSSTITRESVTGETVWHTEVAGEGLVRPGADIDLDGVIDHLLVPMTPWGQNAPSWVRVVDGTTGGVTWERQQPTLSWLSAAVVGAMDGEPGPDLTISYDAEDADGTRHTVFEAVAGTTGWNLWTQRSLP